MPRYVTGPPKAYWDTPATPLPHPTAFASEPVKTGLLDQDGNDIFRATDPIGFLQETK